MGCERQFDLDSSSSIHEKINAERGTDGFDIDVIEGGLPMMDEMKASYDLETLDDDKTMVIFTMRYNTKPSFMAGMMKGMMGKMFLKMLVGLKYHLETKNFVTKDNIKSIVKVYSQLPHQGDFRHVTSIAA